MMLVVGTRGAICVALGVWLCRQLGIERVYGSRENWPVLTIRGLSGAISMVRLQTIAQAVACR